jgi:HTH-type transcriptional regulator / antitoxin HipB
MTQKELAEIIGVQEQQIQRYEAAHYSSTSFDRLQVIASALQIDITQAVMQRNVSPIGENVSPPTYPQAG